MQTKSNEKKKRIVIKKASKILGKAHKKRNYELGKYGPFKPEKRSRSIGKRVQKIKLMK